MKIYRSKSGKYCFKFVFFQKNRRIDVFCLQHPPSGGKSPSPNRTHMMHNGQISFPCVAEPKTQLQAEVLTAQWAEGFLEYCRSGNFINSKGS